MQRINILCGIVILYYTVGYSPLYAQASYNPQTPHGMTTDGVFQNFGVDSVDIKTGRAFIDIPLFSLPQRGQMKTMPFDLTMNTNNWSLGSPINESFMSGATTIVANYIYQYGNSSGTPTIGTSSFYGIALNRGAYIIDGTGAQHRLYEGTSSINTSGQSFATDGSGYVETVGAVFDGSGRSITLDWGGGGDGGSFSDGVSIVESNNFYTVITDPDNNSIMESGAEVPFFPWDENGGQQPFQLPVVVDVSDVTIPSISKWIDTVGRIIPYYTPSYNVPGGVGNLSLCPVAPTGEPAPIAEITWTVPVSTANPASPTSQYVICYATAYINTNFFGYGGPKVLSTNATPCSSVVSNPTIYCAYQMTLAENNLAVTFMQSIVLPSGETWKFAYDTSPSLGDSAYTYGTMKRIITPTGGAISYCYTLAALRSVQEYIDWPDPYISAPNSLTTVRVPVISRRIETEQDTTAACSDPSLPGWSYDYGADQSGSTVTVTDPAGNDTQHAFSYQQMNSGSTEYVWQPDPTQNEITRIYYAGSAAGGNVIKEMTFDYTSIAAPLPPNTTPTPGGSGDLINVPTGSSTYMGGTPQNGILVDTTTQSPNYAIQGSLWACGILTQQFGTTPAGSPLCVTGAPQSLPTGVPSSTATASSTGVNLQTTAYQWNSNSIRSDEIQSVTTSDLILSRQTTFAYDETGYVSSGLGLGHKTGVTQVNNSGASPTVHVHYDSYGMPDITYDAKGVMVTKVLAWDSQHLFPTQIQTQLGTITQSHNPDTGQLLSQTDVNGNTTTYTYDSANRPVSVQYPDALARNSLSTYYCYIGSNTVVTYTAQTSVLGAPSSCGAAEGDSVVTTTVLDGLGRTSSVTTGTSGGDMVTTSTIYDAMGRVYQQSNPYRGSSSSAVWTTYHYDALGRVIQIDEPDGVNHKYWTYGVTSTTNGNTTTNLLTTTATDEKGNQIETVVDALGRTVEVLEPNVNSVGTPQLNVATQYSYNIFGVTGIVQSGDGNGSPRSRSFNYDSLARLLTSTNPETGTICYGTWSAGVCAEGYDLNGNLQKKSDARGVITNYTYDSLNRLTAAVPSDPNGTPSSCYSYDKPTVPNGIGRLFAQWTQKGSCPTIPGSGTQTETAVSSYDAVGRVLAYTQCVLKNCTEGKPYSLTQMYTMSGATSYWDNGLGSIGFSPSYDSLGRLNALTSTWSDATHPGTLLSVPSYNSSSPSYSPAGALQQWTVGNNLNFLRTYDPRLRVTSETVTKP